MKKKSIILGRLAKKFAKTVGCYTVDEYLSEVEQLEKGNFFVGQYLTKGKLDEIIKFLPSVGNNIQIASETLTHKHRPENYLISNPKKIKEGCFEADIWINGQNELLQDHVTGCHVQGMILIEVVRQMFIAVGEQFYAREWLKNKYVVIHQINTNFIQFTFPLPCIINQQITNFRDGSNSLRFSADFFIQQNGQKTFTAQASYSIYDSTRLVEKEEALAKQAVNIYLESKGVA